MASTLIHSRSGELETDLHVELAVHAFEQGAPEQPAADKGADSKGRGAGDTGADWTSFEQTAGWVTVGLGAIGTVLTVVGATTDQVHVMTTSFPDAVKAMFLLALLAIVLAGAAWVVPNGTPLSSKATARPGGADPKHDEHDDDALRPPRRLVRVVAVAAVVGALFAAWAMVRIPGPDLSLACPIVLSLVVSGLFLLRNQTVTGALMITAVAMFAMAAGTAVHLGVNATKFGTGMSAVPAVTVEGATATVSVAVKATQLPVRGGMRVYLVDRDAPSTTLGDTFLAATVSRAVDSTVTFRVPAALVAAQVRLAACQFDPDAGMVCSTAQDAQAVATVAVATAPAAAPSLAASIASTDVTGVYAITVTGTGLRDPVAIEVRGLDALNATARADASGSLTWTTTMQLGRTPWGLSVNATAGDTTATATLLR